MVLFRETPFVFHAQISFSSWSMWLSRSAGVQAAWELRLSDLSVESFDDMNVINFRQIFADREFEPGMMQLEVRERERVYFGRRPWCVNE